MEVETVGRLGKWSSLGPQIGCQLGEVPQSESDERGFVEMISELGALLDSGPRTMGRNCVVEREGRT